ncbi:putative reverse transcriptase domain-containing protein [Tanacetum coccineum]
MGDPLPNCNKCHLHTIIGPAPRCHKCNKIGHFARDCRSTGNTNVANTQKGNGATPKGNGCFECGAPGHFKRDCPKLKNKNRGNGDAQGWVYAVRNAEKSEMHQKTLWRMSSRFDVIIGMDWLRRYHAVIVCDEKLVQVPYRNETFTFCGNESSNGRESRLTVISCSKAQEYMAKGCQIEDVQIVRDFPEVFPEDLPGLPPARPVEFQIDLILGAAPVARAPYRLAPPEMKELLEQLQELSDKGFIRPSSSPWGARSCLSKRRTVYIGPGQDRVYQDWASPKTPTENRQFVGLAGYYRRFIEGFSKEFLINDEKLLRRGIKFDWGKRKNAFQWIKQSCVVPQFWLTEGPRLCVYNVMPSHKGLGAVLMPREKVIAF